MAPIKVFSQVYAQELQILCAKDPTFYGWIAHKIPAVSRKMTNAVKRGAPSYCLTNRALRATCRRLGISCTYRSIDEYVRMVG